MDVDKEEVLAAINGDREALFRAFVWGITTQGHSYWEAQWIGCAPIDVATLREMIGGGEEMETGTPKLWRDMSELERANVHPETLNDPTNPLQIPWGEWTREAKGAVLLAYHDGKVIEYCSVSGEWRFPASGSPALHDVNAYRVKLEPVRETVGLYAGLDRKRHPLPIGTIDLIDGEPDLTSIKMEKL